MCSTAREGREEKNEWREKKREGERENAQDDVDVASVFCSSHSPSSYTYILTKKKALAKERTRDGRRTQTIEKITSLPLSRRMS